MMSLKFEGDDPILTGCDLRPCFPYLTGLETEEMPWVTFVAKNEKGEEYVVNLIEQTRSKI